MRETKPREPHTAASATSSDREVVVPAMTTDAEITGRISAAVHEPFQQVWRHHHDEWWVPVRRALEWAVAAHDAALGHLSAERDPADEVGTPAEELFEQYFRSVSEEVLKPLAVVLRGSRMATSLEESLASTADDVRASLAKLPAVVQSPISGSALDRAPGMGFGPVFKRMLARAIRPLVWRGDVHDVPLARIARQHLRQVVLRHQALAFRESQRSRAVWLGHLERAWAEWIAAVFVPQHREPEAKPARPAHAEAVRAAGTALQAKLRGLGSEITQASGKAGGEDFGRLTGILAATVAVAGTFAADAPSSRPLPGRQRELARRWDHWAEGAPARVDLYRNLLAMRHGTDAIRRVLLGEWRDAVQCVDRVLKAVAAVLARGHKRAEGLAEDGDGLPAALESERTQIDDALDRMATTLEEPELFFSARVAEAERAVAGIDALSNQMPDSFALHDIPEPGERLRRPSGDPHVVRARQTARQAFDALARERIRAAPSLISTAMGRVRVEIAELREVTTYGYEAAVAELREGDESDFDRPVVLVLNGLSQADRKVTAARQALHDALAVTAARVGDEVGEGLQQMKRRVTADRLAVGYLEARSYLIARIIQGWKRWRPRLGRAAARLRTGLRAGYDSARLLAGHIGIGPAVPSVSAESDERTLDSAHDFLLTLPAVYRRLFAFEPVTDPRLLAGREDALAAVEAAWTRRAAGRGRSLIVIASPGVGITSFLNVVAGRLSEGEKPGVRRTFRERVREESRLAGCLATWLGLEEAHDLDALADRVLNARPEALPRFAILERAEHLHMRTPGGSELFERLLTFMSRTESKVFWIVAMTSSAWQLVDKRAPDFGHDLERVTLDELSSEQFRQAILARHRLSGLPIHYAEARDGRAVLRRRTRQWRGTAKHARFIEADYFQRLRRASLGSIRLALFHWLRSADFNTVEGSLLVQPLRPLDLGMTGLKSTHGFALKAILDHGTLTVAEYCDVARASEPESLHLFRSMEDLRVIEAVTDAASAIAEDEGRTRTARYRIRPIMLGAVMAHLRSRNILH